MQPKYCSHAKGFGEEYAWPLSRVFNAMIFVVVLAGSAFAFEQAAGVPESDPGALDRVRERLTESALRGTQGGKDVKGAAQNAVIGSKWWIVYRRASDADAFQLKTFFKDVPWFKIVEDESWNQIGMVIFEYPNGQRGGGIKAERFEELVQQNVFVNYDPTEEIQAEIRKEKAEAQKRESNAKIANAKAREKRIEAIKAKKWPLPVEQAVIERQVQIGMTTEQVTMAWGKPANNNRSVGSWGTHEQWVYGETYLYFQNGVLTSYQERR